MTDIKRKTVDGDIKENPDDAPPNSRLFVICGKDITEDDFRDAFEVHGTIEKIEIHRDKKGESKGIAYIKFSKTSEAAIAIEQLNGRCIGDHPRPLKVLIANSRDQGNSREFKEKEEERLLRLFVVVPKDQVETDLKEYFSRFGAVQYVNIVKDKETRISKGFAYIKYYRLSHAAKAFETCDRSYKPVFADPRPPKCDDFTNGHIPRSISDPGRQADSCVLSVVCSPTVNEDQLWRLFDLIPGLDYCELRQVDPRNNRSFGIAVYTNIRAATYAKKKLHGFEYPPGERLIVKFEPADHHFQYRHPQLNQAYSQLSHLNTYPHHLKTLADKIAQATSLIKAANLNDPCQYSYDPSYCTISLPRPQPLAPMDSNVEERLFVVCTPSIPPIYAVKDVFGRFGGLVDFYFLNGKRCGYALFSKEESAKAAMNSLNGQEICGSRMKVMLAEPTKGNFSE